MRVAIDKRDVADDLRDGAEVTRQGPLRPGSDRLRLAPRLGFVRPIEGLVPNLLISIVAKTRPQAAAPSDGENRAGPAPRFFTKGVPMFASQLAVALALVLAPPAGAAANDPVISEGCVLSAIRNQEVPASDSGVIVGLNVEQGQRSQRGRGAGAASTIARRRPKRSSSKRTTKSPSKTRPATSRSAIRRPTQPSCTRPGRS